MLHEGILHELQQSQWHNITTRRPGNNMNEGCSHIIQMLQRNRKVSAMPRSYLAALGKKAFEDTGELGDWIASSGELHSIDALDVTSL